MQTLYLFPPPLKPRQIAGGNIMKNYQQFHYRTYYRMRPSGETVECTRQECFAPAETPTADNPFVQRWYYSPDREVAIRLPRNVMGDDTHKANAADLKLQERWTVRAAKHGDLEIDKPMSRTDDGEESGFDIPDDADGPVEFLIKKETVTSIRIAVDVLTPDERYLWDELLSDKTKAKIAEECGLSEGAIRKRVKKLARTLLENPALKNYFE
ncbi:MAG: sigma-70 family RNA polymerase sigma factor [Clostridiales bacterium]|jgi:hypothetical protein|nr:sigma-70 family RNA polymerase sigma factor [Clostridiales bacterium]